MKSIREKLASWFVATSENGETSTEENVALLKNVTAHMLIHAARYDGHTDPAELEIIRDILIEAFGDTAEEADALIEQVTSQADEKDDWYQHLRQITQTIEHEERMALIHHLWMVILADGRIDSYEANFMRRIGALLGVSDRDLNAIKVALKNQ